MKISQTYKERRADAVRRLDELRKEIPELVAESKYLERLVTNPTTEEKKEISVTWDGQLSVTGKLVHFGYEKQELILQLFDSNSDQPYVYASVASLKELGNIASAAGLKRFFVEQRIKHPRVKGAHVPVTLFPSGEVDVLQNSIVGIGEVEKKLQIARA